MIIVRNDLSEKLNYLTILAEEQNITRAAARLFVSQPALTAYLNRLEAELGTKLFDRSKTPIKITPAGAYYISEMEKISAQQDRLQHELKQIDFDPEMKLNIGIGRNRGSLWLPKILPRLYSEFPDAHLSISEDRDINMSEKVVRGILDVAIVETYAYRSMLTYMRLPEERHLLITHPDNPVAVGRYISGNSPESPLDVEASLLCDQLFICPNIRGGLNRSTQWLFSTFNFNPKRLLFVMNDATSYQLAVNGVGVTFQNSVYSKVIRTEGTPLFIMPGGKPTLRKVFAVFTDESMTQLKRAFLRITHDVMSEELCGHLTEPEYM